MRQEKGAGSCLFRICAPSGLLSIPVVTPTGLFTLAKAAASSFHPSTSEGTQVLASPKKHWQVASCRDTEFYLFCLRAFPLNPQIKLTWGFPGGSDGKESACNVGDFGSVPGLGRSPGEGMATHSSILAWRIPWTEDPDGLQFMGSQKSQTWLSN